MKPGAGLEWRSFWPLPIAAAIGNSTSVVHTYAMGAFMVPLEQAFGWSRAEISLGGSFGGAVAAGMAILVGTLIDRWGPRRIGLAGVAIACSALALLGTATGSLANWFALWCLIGVGGAWVTPAIWTSGVASRFDASRGLAIAVVVAGSGVAATIVPAIAAYGIAQFGWRHAFFLLAGLWAAVGLPILFLFFRGAQDNARGQTRADRGHAGDVLAGLSVAQGVRISAFYKLGIAGGLFAFAVIGLIFHFVPVLQDLGASRMGAAGIAGLVGASSIAGRLGTGYLLDRFRPERIAMLAFLLPVASALLLLASHSTVSLSLAALIVGLSLGSELDVVLFLATRHFGLRRFGTLFTLMLVFLSAGTAFGPVYAGAIFDHFDSYRWFLWSIIPLVATGAMLVGALGQAPVHAAPGEA